MRPFYYLLVFITIPVISFCHDHGNEKLIYIENKGQWNENALFKTSLRNGAIFLEKDKITVNVTENKSHRFQETDVFSKPCKGHSYSIEFLNSNSNVQISGKSKFDEYFNYFLGDDPKKWHGNCLGYEEVLYKNIYPYIDLIINSKDFQPKYTFYLKKGAKVNDIKMKFNGLSDIYLDKNGDLISNTVLGEIRDEKPISFIHEEGIERTVASKFVLKDSIVSFEVDCSSIQENQILEIDPQIIFSTYSGSTADNFGATATYDDAGNLYGSGLVFGAGYPSTTGAYQTTFGGSSDVAITKFNAAGSARLYSTYIGGNSFDVPHSLVVDDNNRLILLATTSSSNFPTTTGAFRTSFSGGPALTTINSLGGLGVQYPNGADITITKFNPSGTGLIGSTFFGGTGTDGVGITNDLVINYGDNVRGEIETDTFGNIYVASLSNSGNLPTLANSFRNSNSGGFDGILIKLNTNLTTLLGFTYFGGSGNDALYDLCFDNSGNIVAAGGTNSTNIGITSGVVNTTYGGNTDGMVVSLTNDLSSMRFASYYGTADYDQIYFVETDGANQVYLLGQTTHNSSNYYLFNATYSNPHTGQFVSILNPTATSKVRSTTIGAGNQNPDISPTAFLVDYCDKIFITGWGSNLGSFNSFALSTTGLPVTSNAFQSTTLGNGFYMSILEGDLSSQYYGTFFGGTTALSREHVDGGTCRFDKNGIVYHAVCAGCGGQNNLPIYPNASSVVSSTNNSSNCNLGVFKFDFGLPVTANFSYTPVCAPGNVQFFNHSHIVNDTTVKYYWTFSNGDTSTSKEPNINFTNPGIYSAQLVIIDSSSCNFSDTLIKSVIMLGTTADSLSDKVICPGSSAKIGFTNIIDTGITFNWSPTNTIDDPTILSPFASPTATTTYRLIMSKSGCTDTFFQTVIVEAPKALEIMGDSLSCAGAISNYLANFYPQGNYDWLPKGILNSSSRDTAEFQFASFPVEISVNYISENGCVSTAKKTINGGGTPNLTLKSDSIICKGDILDLISSSNMKGGSLTFSPSINVISQNGDTSRIQIDTTMNLAVTYTISPTCIAKDTISFTLLKDKVSWSIDSIICLNDLAIATANTNPAYTISWQPSSTLTTPQGQSPANFNLSNVNRNVYINATHNQRSLCQFNDSAFIKFVELIVKLRGDTVKCKDSTITIYHGNSSGTIKTWSPNSLLISQTDTSATFNVPSTGLYKLTITDNSCTRSDSIRIHILNDLVHLTGDSIICPTDTSKIQATHFDKATYKWTPFPPIIGKSDTSTILAKSETPQWYYVHIQDTNKCYIFDSFFVNHLDSTNVAKADFKANTNCQNQTVQFKNSSRSTSANPTYYWDFAGQGNSNLENPSFTFNSYGLQEVTLAINDNNSCNKSDTIRKTIYILNNQLTILPTIKSCKGDSVNIGLESMLDSGVTITWTPNNNMSGDTTFYPKVLVNDSTIFTAIISKGGCTDTLVQTVLVDTPKSIQISGPTNLCQFTESIYTANKYTEGTYNWTPFSNISYQNRDTVKLIITNNTTLIRVHYISEYKCSSYDSLTVQISPVNLNLQMDSIGCMDEVLTMNYTFNQPGGVFSFIPSSNIVSHTNSSAQYKVDTSRIVSVEYRINNACFDIETINFKLLEDAVSWKPDTISCRNQSTTAIANINNRWSILWGPSNLLQSSQGNSPAQFGTFANDEDIYIEASLLNRPSCNYKDTARVSLFENQVEITGPISNCLDSFVDLTATLFPNTSYNWGPNNALFNSNLNSATFKTDISRYYFVTATFNNQCTSIDSHFITTGNPNFKLWADTVVCPDDTVTLFASNLPNASYLWSNGATTTSTLVTVTQPTTYFIDVIDSNGCSLNDSIRILTFTDSLVKLISEDSIVCKFDTVKLELPDLQNVSYQWVPNQPILSGQGTHKIEAWIDTNTRFYYLVTLARGNANCPPISDSIFIQRDTQYLKISGNQIVCYNDTLDLKANYNSSFTYYWTPTNWIVNNGHEVSYQVIDSVLVLCEAISSFSNKCKYRDSVKIDYSRFLDNLHVTATPDEIQYGTSAILNADAWNIVGYEWSPSKTLSNSLIPSPIATPDTTTTYYVTVRDPLGCRSSDSVIVTVTYEICDDPEVYIPTAFTPNSDGKNDALFVMGDNILEVHLMIYDRWGQLVFETDHQKKGWDGTYNGIELEPGVFAYYLHVECIGGASLSKKGNITILK